MFKFDALSFKKIAQMKNKVELHAAYRYKLLFILSTFLRKRKLRILDTCEPTVPCWFVKNHQLFEAGDYKFSPGTVVGTLKT